jgi:hypothetical protein
MRRTYSISATAMRCCLTPEPEDRRQLSPPGAPLKRRKADPEPSPLVLPPSAADLERLAAQFADVFGKIAEEELPAVLRLVRQAMAGAGMDPASLEEPRGRCLNDMTLPAQAYTLDALVDQMKMMAMSWTDPQEIFAGEGARNAYLVVRCTVLDLDAVQRFFSKEFSRMCLESLPQLDVCLEKLRVKLLFGEDSDVLFTAAVSTANVLYVRDAEMEVAAADEVSRDAPTTAFVSEASRDAPTEAFPRSAESAADEEGKLQDARMLETLGITPSKVVATGSAELDAALKETYMALRLMGGRVAAVYVIQMNHLVKKGGHSFDLVKRLVESGTEAEAEAFPEKEPGPVVVDRKTWLDKDTSGFARLRYVAGLLKDVNAMVEEDVASGAILKAPITPELDLTEMYRHQLWTKLVVIQTSARMGETEEEHSKVYDAYSRAYLRLAVAFQDLELAIFKHKEASA